MMRLQRGFCRLLAPSRNPWHLGDGSTKCFELVVGVALVDPPAGMARQLHAHFLGYTGIGQLAGEAVP